jgi:hypothetical protein
MRASMTHGNCANRQVCRPSQMCAVSAVVLVCGGPKFVTEAPVEVADTGFVSLGAVVQYVGEVLGRAHSLFGDPADSGGGAASSAGGGLGGAGAVVRSNEAQVSGLSGDFVSAYSGFTGKAAPGLDNLAGLDDRLGGTLSDAAGADRDGRSQSAAVVNGAQTDTAALAPWTGTPAGQKALLTQLRGRLAAQQQVLAAYQARDARMAAMLRSMAYRARMGGGGGMPFSPAGLGGLGGGASPDGGLGSMPGLSGLSGLASAPVTLASALHPAGAQGLRLAGGLPSLGSLTLNSSPKDVGAVLFGEAARRGYSPDRAIAVVSTFMQESGMNPRAVSPNGQWVGLAQEDNSYSGRSDPNQAINEFFNRLDAKGGRTSADIWKTIFWLQQRPGDPSAEIAVSNGRRAYLSELQQHTQAATQMYHELSTPQTAAMV